MNKMISKFFFLFFFFAFSYAHAGVAYTYNSEQSALSGCASEGSAKILESGSGVKKALCDVNVYPIRAYFCTALDTSTNCTAGYMSSNIHFHLSEMEIGQYEYADNALDFCRDVVLQKDKECNRQNVADSLLGNTPKLVFDKCKTSNNKAYPYYNGGVYINQRGYCYISFDKYNRPGAPTPLTNVYISGFRKYSGNAPLYSTYQQGNVLFKNDLDRNFTGYVDWTYGSSNRYLEIQVKVDFGSEMGISDIEWARVKDSAGVFSKADNETHTYLRTLPQPLYSWFYDRSAPRFVLSEVTSTKYVHIHYRFRTKNESGISSDWSYLKAISIYHSD